MPIKKLILLIIPSAVILLFILFPSFAINSAYTSLQSWFNDIVPSLFPFIICVNMLSSSVPSFSGAFGKLFKALFNISGKAFTSTIIGMVSGYPMGGKIVSDLYSKGIIDSDEAQRLLSFINNPSPVLAICVIGSKMLNSPAYGRLIYLSCFLGAFLTALIFKFYFTHHPIKNTYRSSPESSSNIVVDSVSSILIIGAYIIFFGILCDVLAQIPTIGGIIASFTELTKGAAIISGLTSNMRIKTTALSFLLSLGGICIQFQIMSFLKNIPFKKSTLIVSSIIKASFSAIFCYIFFPFFSYSDTAHVFSPLNLAYFSSGWPLLKITIPSAALLFILTYKKRQA